MIFKVCEYWIYNKKIKMVRSRGGNDLEKRWKEKRILFPQTVVGCRKYRKKKKTNPLSVKTRKSKKGENNRQEMHIWKIFVGSLFPNLPIHTLHFRDSGVCWMAVANTTWEGLILHGYNTPRNNIIPGVLQAKPLMSDGLSFWVTGFQVSTLYIFCLKKQ